MQEIIFIIVLNLTCKLRSNNNREPQGARIKEWVKRVWESQGYKKKKTGEGLKEWPNHLVLLSNYQFDIRKRRQGRV